MVRTAQRELHGRVATVVCAGVWSGELLSEATGIPGFRKLLQPRRGHLLEVARPVGMPEIKTGMMEMSYTKVGGGRGRGGAESLVCLLFVA